MKTFFVVVSLLLLPFSVLAADTAPPAITGGFSIRNISNDSATLSWTVPSDDVGVARYEVRGRTGISAMMTESDWSTAAILATPPPPSIIPPGNIQYYFWSGLTPGTMYSIGFKAFDAAGNGSPIAVLTFTTTGNAPVNTVPGQPQTVTPPAVPVAPTPAKLPTGGADLVITVHEPNGKVLPNASVMVTICQNNSCVSGAGTTDSLGSYTFQGLASGIYTVKATPPLTRSELAASNSALVTLFGGGVASQDIILSLAPVTPPVPVIVPTPVPVVVSPQPPVVQIPAPDAVPVTPVAPPTTQLPLPNKDITPPVSSVPAKDGSVKAPSLSPIKVKDRLDSTMKKDPESKKPTVVAPSGQSTSPTSSIATRPATSKPANPVFRVIGNVGHAIGGFFRGFFWKK